MISAMVVCFLSCCGEVVVAAMKTTEVWLCVMAGVGQWTGALEGVGLRHTV